MYRSCFDQKTGHAYARHSTRETHRTNRAAKSIPTEDVEETGSNYQEVFDIGTKPQDTAAPDIVANNAIQAVERASRILRAFTVARPRLSLSELTSELGTGKQTAHR
ncbi:MAG: hypothetical protein DI630_30055, partial [Gordonia sp. (in: high G+C Gram-positive bacteria)]